MSLEHKMTPTAFNELVRHILVLYVAGGKGYNSLMDELVMNCSDSQWTRFESYLDEANTWLVEDGVGTVYQTEQVLSKREGRPSRFPSIFNHGDPDYDEEIASIRADLVARHIPFKDDIHVKKA